MKLKFRLFPRRKDKECSSQSDIGGNLNKKKVNSNKEKKKTDFLLAPEYRNKKYIILNDSYSTEDGSSSNNVCSSSSSSSSPTFSLISPISSINSSTSLRSKRNSAHLGNLGASLNSVEIMEESASPNNDSKAAAGVSTSNHVYVKCSDCSWRPARLLRVEFGTKATVSVAVYKDEQSMQSDGGKGAIKFYEDSIDLKDYPGKTLLLQNVDEHGNLITVEDMVDLPYLHEPAILYNLKARHVSSQPYTRTGDIIIAVNPYQWLNHLYSEQTRCQYAQQLVWGSNDDLHPAEKLPPHVYETSSLAYRGLALEGQDQSILVSGESGAGKTETVKILLSDIASVQRGFHTPQKNPEQDGDDAMKSPIVQRVLDSNPLLEAFGNAKTSRNDNSSRFGKYIQLQFDCEDPVQAAYVGKNLPSCVLAGSTCEVYLLEKSRVVLHEPDNERTYHIFYQLLAAPEDLKTQIWEGLADTDNESFSFVGYTDTHTIEGMTDQQRFQRTVESLALVGVQGDSLRTLLRAICIVLQLGNLLFEPDERDESKSVIASPDELEDLSLLMGVDTADLAASLTVRTMRARNEEFKVPLNAETAKDSCDAFAKEIYAKAFLWLVRSINDATCAELNYDKSSTSNQQYGTIGLLDIFGFESFQVNRFEQLCINYANEKLQQKFTQDIFRSVQTEYEYEGIELGEITYNDNTDVLDLVEGRMGLIAFLNEECLRPGGSDQGFVNKAAAMNKDNDCFIRQRGFRDTQFGVAHYAGKVIYDATAFVTKNMDTLPSDLQDCATQSSNAILSKELTNDSSRNAAAEASAGSTAPLAAGGKKKPKKPPSKRPPVKQGSSSSLIKKKSSNLVGDTVWTKFKNQLTSLMANLKRTRSRYIRCIKPNTFKQPLLMQHTSTIEQLRCAGVVAAVTISRSAFPNRLEHHTVLDRFRALWRKGQQHAAEEHTESLTVEEKAKALAAEMLSAALKVMEITKENGIVQQAFVMGKTRTYFRAGALEYLENERVKCLSTWAVQIQTYARMFTARSKFVRRRTMTIRLESMIRMLMARHTFRRLRNATIRTQNWYRCILAARSIVRLRRNYRATMIQTHWRMAVATKTLKTNRTAAISIQKIMRGAIQRPKFRSALLEKREEAKLENQVMALQRKLEEAERKRVEAEQRAEERMKQQLIQQHQERRQETQQQEGTIAQDETVSPDVPVSHVIRGEEKKDDKFEDAVSALSEPSIADEEDVREGGSPTPIQLSAQQQTLMDESGKMLEYLRKEVFKLRSQNQQIRSDFDLLKDNNQRLMDANASAGASFAALNQHAKMLSRTNEKLNNELHSYKQQVQKLSVTQVELREELKMKQATYVAEVHSRLQYQKALQKIIDVAQEKCRDDRLVEEFLRIADESEYMTSGTSMFSTPTRGEEKKSRDTGLMSSIRSFWS